MKHIKKLRVKNFKKFADEIFEFNDDINIIVGDNESGKSSVLEAIELCLNHCHRGRPLSPEIMSELFNSNCVETYLKGDRSQTSLPELLIEAYLGGDPELKGANNSEGADTQGISLKMLFNPDLSPYYEPFITSGDVLTVPFELYKIEWMSFAWKPLAQLARPVSCLIAKALKHPVRVVKDNDHDYKKNIVDWRNDDYKDCDFIECFSPEDNTQHSLEPALLAANDDTVAALDKLAKVMLSPRTYGIKYAVCTDLEAKRTFMNGWYDSPTKKVDSAIRIFDTPEAISYPDYLMKAVTFDT